MITYEQALKDWQYLWSIASPDDMTGGYVDQRDLEKLLLRPTKITARQCLCDQIEYWFEAGPDKNGVRASYQELCEEFPKLPEIAERHACRVLF